MPPKPARIQRKSAPLPDVRLMESDAIENGLNVRCVAVTKSLNNLRDWLAKMRPRYINQDFDLGYLAAAQRIIEDMIDPEYAPWVSEQQRRLQKALTSAMPKKGPRR